MNIAVQLPDCFCFSDTWHSFVVVGEILLSGFLFHYVPYFFVERTLFLHHYLPAFTFKVLLTAALVEHLHHLLW
jgi:dolichyl-phosphate-mannose-protein mannosyltransferase